MTPTTEVDCDAVVDAEVTIVGKVEDNVDADDDDDDDDAAGEEFAM